MHVVATYPFCYLQCKIELKYGSYIFGCYQPYNDNMSDVEVKTSGETVPNKTFVDMILQMLHALGDVAKPLHETAALICDIVHGQICAVLYISNDIASMRCARAIGMEEILFLLRNNHQKLLHFLHHIEFRATKTKMTNVLDTDNPDAVAVNDDEDEFIERSMKRMKICQKFLSTLDETFSLSSMLRGNQDEDMRLHGHKRAAEQTRNMDTEEYLYFSSCRQASFMKRMSKFKNWFAPVLASLSLQPNQFGWEAVAYLAHETVSELVDFALLVQADQFTSKSNAPESKGDNSTKDLFDLDRSPLTPAHVHEALRRCCLHHQVGSGRSRASLGFSDPATYSHFVGSIPVISLM